jgi:hypothetical protein
VDLFALSWSALRTAVADLPDESFAQPSGCATPIGDPLLRAELHRVTVDWRGPRRRRGGRKLCLCPLVHLAT